MSLMANELTKQGTPTEIYLPEFHFPDGQSEVSVSNGEWTIDFVEAGTARVQRLQWWHAVGQQDIKVEGVMRNPGQSTSASEDISYLKQCQQEGCTVM